MSYHYQSLHYQILPLIRSESVTRSTKATKHLRFKRLAEVGLMYIISFMFLL